MTTSTPLRRARASVRVVLSPPMAEALQERARRNDRFPWLEAGRIIREELIRAGDLPDEPEQAR